MTEVITIELHPRDALGAPVAVRLAGGGRRKGYYYGGEHWRAGLVDRPRFSASLGFDANGWTGGTVPEVTAVVWAPYSAAALAELGSLYWPDAPVTITRRDEDSDAAIISLVGTVASGVTSTTQLTLTIADLGKSIDKPLCPDRFAGTGGIEGGTEAAERIKRRSWGRALNIEGRVLDKAENIYEFGDPAWPLQSFDNVRDMGRAGPFATLAWQGSAAATLAALKATQPEQGGGVAAPSIQCVKWWTQPTLLTADVHGEVGSGYGETAPEIAAAISAAIGGPSVANVAAMVAVRPAPCGIHIGDATETAAQALNRLLLGVSLDWVREPEGTIRLFDWSFANPVASIESKEVERLETFAPARVRRLAYGRAYRVHTEGEISAALYAGDLLYEDGTTVEALKPAEPAATNSADPASAFGPQGTVQDFLGRVVDVEGTVTSVMDLVNDTLGPAVDTVRDEVQLIHGSLDNNILAQFSAQMLSEERKARVDVLTHFNGVPIGTAVSTEISERTQGQQAMVDTVSLIGSKSADNLAFVLNSTKVLVDPTTSLAAYRSQVAADFVTSSGNLSSAVATLQQADSNETQARAVAISSVTASFQGQLGSTTTALITQIDQSVANEAQARTTSVNQARSEFSSSLAATSATITFTRDTLAAADQAAAQRIDSVVTRVGNNESAISSAVYSLTTAQTALSVRIDSLSGRVGAAEGSVTSEAATRQSADASLSYRIDTVTATYSGLAGQVQNNASALANATTSIASLSSQVSAFASPTLNLVTNSTFASGATGWSLGGGWFANPAVQDVGHGGAGSGLTEVCYGPTFAVAPNARYSLSAELWTPDLQGGNLVVDIMWLDAGGSAVGYSGRIAVNSVISSYQRFALNGSDYLMTSPGNASRGQVRLFLENATLAGNGTVAARRIQVERSDVAHSWVEGTNTDALTATVTTNSAAIADLQSKTAAAIWSASASSGSASASVTVLARTSNGSYTSAVEFVCQQYTVRTSSGALTPIFAIIGDQVQIGGNLVVTGSIVANSVTETIIISVPGPFTVNAGSGGYYDADAQTWVPGSGASSDVAWSQTFNMPEQAIASVMLSAKQDYTAGARHVSHSIWFDGSREGDDGGGDSISDSIAMCRSRVLAQGWHTAEFRWNPQDTSVRLRGLGGTMTRYKR